MHTMSPFGAIKSIAVRNIEGTSDWPPPAGFESWRDFYEAETGRWPNGCCVARCFATAEVGGHIRLEHSADRSVKIAPLCHRHNRRWGEVLGIFPGTMLVVAPNPLTSLLDLVGQITTVQPPVDPLSSV